jgi:glycosyltransferase involved in cell wall biosynthesis
VLASRFETYGMVVTEALARGLPVLATSVGGLPEALGRSIEGRRPGLLVQPGDARAMSRALRRWLTDDALREDLRRAARQRRLTLKGWDRTADVLSGVLSRVAA